MRKAAIWAVLLFAYPALAANDVYSGRFQPLTGFGVPYPGAQRQCVAAGGSWPTNAQTVYTDPGLTVPAANPVIADANGRFPTVYLLNNTGYKFIFLDAANNTLWTDDNVYGGVSGFNGVLSATSSSSTDAILGTNSSTGAGVHGKNTGTGYGVIAEGLSSSPTKSAFRIVPQAGLASSPVQGDIATLTSNGRSQFYDGTEWLRTVGQVYALISAETESIGTSATTFTSQYSIPANSLIVGTRIKVVAGAEVTAQVGSPSLFCALWIGGASVQLSGSTASSVTTSFSIWSSGEAEVATTGSSGTMNATGIGIWGNAGTSVNSGSLSLSAQTINTTIANAVSFQCTRTGGTSSSVRLDSISVEII